MALKPDYHVVEWAPDFVCNDVISAGDVLCYSTAGSGQAMGADAGVATLKSNPSGFIPLGLSVAAFVSIDETVQHVNFYNNQQVLGDKAPLMRKGWVVSNRVLGSPTAGAIAYLAGTGMYTATNGGAAATPKIGEFKSIKDEDGYAKIEINLPY